MLCETYIKDVLIYLTLNVRLVKSVGLYHGRMGYAIFFSKYNRMLQQPIYDTFVNDLLDEIWDDFNSDLPLNMENGMCGIGLGIEYLVQNHFVEGETDEILSYIDSLVMECQPKRMQDLSMRRGLAGIAYYVMARFSSPRKMNKLPFTESFLEELQDAIQCRFSGCGDEAKFISNFVLVREGKIKIKPDLSILFPYSFCEMPPNELLKKGLEYCWGLLDVCYSEFLLGNDSFLEGNNYCLINEFSDSAAYGIGSYLKQVAFALKSTQWKLNVITLRSPKNSLLCMEEKDNVRYINIGTTYCGLEYWGWKNYFKRYYGSVLILLSFLYQKERKMIFHLNNMHMTELAFHLKQIYWGSKVICTVHYMDWALDLLGDRRKLAYLLAHPEEEKHKSTSIVLEENKRFLQICDLVIAVSKHSFKTLVEVCHVPESKIVLMPHGIRDEYVEISRKEKNRRREKFGFHPDDIILVYAGRIEPLKGVDLLAEVFSLLVLKFPHLRLLIAGGGSLGSVLSKVANVCGRVSFTGFVDKKLLYELFSISNIGVLPSLYEEFGYVALEMMMMDLPVAVGNRSGLEEIIEGGKYGWLIPFEQDYEKSRENVMALYNLLFDILEKGSWKDEFQQGKSRKRFVTQFDMNCFTQAFLQEVINRYDIRLI